MQDEESTPPGGIKVVDKRRFTESGDARGAADDKLREREPMKAEKQSRPEPPPPRNAAPQSAPSAAGESVEFSSFIVSLATQALAMMGEINHPELQGIPKNVEAARETIDLLSMLETKTRGNLTETETKLLTEILSSLRLAYVKRAK